MSSPIIEMESSIQRKRLVLSIPLQFGTDLSIRFNNSELVQLNPIHVGTWIIFSAPFEPTFTNYSIYSNKDQKILFQSNVQIEFEKTSSEFFSYLPSPKLGEIRLNLSILFQEFINEISSIEMIKEYFYFLEEGNKDRIEEFKEFVLKMIIQEFKKQDQKWILDRLQFLDPFSTQQPANKIRIIRLLQQSEPFKSSIIDENKLIINKLVISLKREVNITDWFYFILNTREQIEVEYVTHLFEHLSRTMFSDFEKQKLEIFEIKQLLEQISQTEHVLASEYFLKQIKIKEFLDSHMNNRDLENILQNFSKYSCCLDSSMIENFCDKEFTNPVFIQFIPSILNQLGRSFERVLNNLYSEEKLANLETKKLLEILQATLKIQAIIGQQLSQRVCKSLLSNNENANESQTIENFAEIFKIISSEENLEVLVNQFKLIFTSFLKGQKNENTINSILKLINQISELISFKSEIERNQFFILIAFPIFERITSLLIKDFLNELKEVSDKKSLIVKQGIQLKVEDNLKLLEDKLNECEIVVMEAETSKDELIMDFAQQYEESLIIQFCSQIKTEEFLSNNLTIQILKRNQKLKKFQKFFRSKAYELFQTISSSYTFQEFEKNIFADQNLLEVFEHFQLINDILSIKEQSKLEDIECQKYLRFQSMSLNRIYYKNEKLFVDQMIRDSHERIDCLNQTRIFYEAYYILADNQVFQGYLEFLKQQISEFKNSITLNEEIDFVFSSLVIFIKGITSPIMDHKLEAKNKCIYNLLSRVLLRNPTIQNVNSFIIFKVDRFKRKENLIEILNCLEKLQSEGFGVHVSENIQITSEQKQNIYDLLDSFNELEILLDQFNFILTIANIFQLDLWFEPNKQFLNIIVDFDQKQHSFSIPEFIQVQQALKLSPQISLQNFSQQLTLFSQTEELINYLGEYQGVNFIDLREYVEEDDFEMNSILIKFGKHQLFFNELEKQKRYISERNQLISIQELLGQLLAISKKYLGEEETKEIFECLANFKKVSSLQKATQKKEQLGNLCLNIMNSGVFTFQLSSRTLLLKIECEGVNLTEQKIREIYSRIHVSQSAIRNSKDDHWIQQRFVQVNNLKEEWKLIQQIKQVLTTLIAYGNTEQLAQPIIFTNSNQIPFNEQLQTIKNHLNVLEEFLQEWKKNIPLTLSEYPHLSMFGFKSYHDFCYNYNFQNSNPISQILLTLGISHNRQNLLLGVEYEFQFKKLSSINKLKLIGKLIQSKSSFALGSDSLRSRMSSPKMITYLQFQSQNETMKFLLSQMATQRENIRPQYYEFFICENHSTEYDLELFLLRFEYFVQKTTRNYFLIFPDRQFELSFISSTLELISALLKKESTLRNRLFIISSENHFLRNIKSLQPSHLQDLPHQTNIQPFCNSNAEFIYSKFPGEGKTFLIQQEIQNQKINAIRIPTYCSTKERIIQLLRKSPAVQFIHIDLYENPEIDLNYLLFELLYLNSLTLHDNDIILLNNPIFYVEISNTVNNRLYNSLSTLVEDNGLQKQVFNLNNYVLQFLGNEQKQNAIACFVYLSNLSDLEKINQQEQNIPLNLSSSDLIKFQLLLKTHFLNKFNTDYSTPCFYQVSRFVNLFGSEMIKFTRSKFLKPLFLYQNKISYEIRSYVVLKLYEFALRLSIQISKPNMCKLTQEESQKLSQSLQNAKLLEKKFSSIEGINSLEMDIITFQENQAQDITSFFLQPENISTNLKQLYRILDKQLLILDKKSKDMTPEKLKNWLLDLIHDPSNNLQNNHRNQNHSKIQEMISNFAIERDNFFKTTVIFMTLRAQSSSILMGESGIGKTALISLLSTLMNAKFEVMQIHAGITESQVSTKMSELIAEATQQPKKRFIIFFDELNTCKLVGGLFKEIMMDRCLFGVRIPENIIPIGAMNPYKLKTEKMRNMESLHINGSMKRYLHDEMKTSHLQFTVEPLPESMFSIVKNFEVLSESNERFYTSSIIQLCSRSLNHKHPFSDSELDQFSQLVHTCQCHLRLVMDSLSACSLRDVKRATNLFFWLVTFQKKINNESIRKINQFRFCVSISLWIVYIVRLPKVALRKQFYEICQMKLYHFRQFFIMEIVIDQVSEYVAHQCSTHQTNILKNSALNQNLLALLISIQNKIPVILIGPPGSSKTLSLTIIVNSMKGDLSTNEFFRNFLAVMPSTYQGHIESTSARLIEVFDNASQKQAALKQQNQDDKYVQLVCFEEIGLAEMSPHNPLKTLHPILENPEYSIVSVSNWPLDQSKMNRMISVYRLDTTEDELFETMIRQRSIIYKNVHPNHELVLQKDEEQTMKRIINVYLSYLDMLQNQARDFHQFHGMRDFYGMIRMYFRDRRQIEEGKEKLHRSSNESALKAFMRHMQGYPLISNYLYDALIQHKFEPRPPANDYSLIMENLKECYEDFTTRHLMIITPNPSAMIDFIKQQLSSLGKPHQVIIGSGFEMDKGQDRSFEVLHRIIACAESGEVMVLSNLDTVYQSLYELVNQNYRMSHGAAQCSLSLGSETNHFEVSPLFKLIIVIPKDQVPNNIDGPLLNRFEKHYFDPQSFNEDMIQDRNKLIHYFTKSEQGKSIIPFSNKEEIISNLHYNSPELSFDEMKTQIIRLSTFQEALAFKVQKRDISFEYYIQSGYHFGFGAFIQKRIKFWQEINSKNNMFFITSFDSYQKQESSTYFNLNLSLIDSAAQFDKELEKFEAFVEEQVQSNPATDPILLIISCSIEEIKQIGYISYRMAEINIKLQEKIEGLIRNNQLKSFQKFAMIITMQAEVGFKLPLLNKGWEFYHIEELFPRQLESCYQTSMNLSVLIAKKMKPLHSVIRLEKMIQEYICIHENVVKAFRSFLRMVRNQSNMTQKKLSQFLELFCSNSSSQYRILISFMIQIMKVMIFAELSKMNIISVEQFLINYVFISQREEIGIMNRICNSIKALIHNSFVYFILALEESGLVYSFTKSKGNANKQKKLLQLFIESLGVKDLPVQDLEINDFLIAGISPLIQSRQLDCFRQDLIWRDSIQLFEHIEGFIERSDGEENQFSINSLDESIKSVFNLQELTFFDVKTDLNLIYNKKYPKKSDVFKGIANAMVESMLQKSNSILPKGIYQMVLGILNEEEITQIEKFINKYAIPKIIEISVIFNKGFVPKNSNHIFLKEFTTQIAKFIVKKLEPSLQLQNIVANKQLNYKELLSCLLYSIEDFNIGSHCELEIQKVKIWLMVEKLIPFSLQIECKEVVITSNYQLLQLNQQHLKDYSRYLESHFILNNCSSSLKRFGSYIVVKDFKERWNTFNLELIDYAIQIIRWESFSLLGRVLQIIGEVEEFKRAQVESDYNLQTNLLPNQKVKISQIVKTVMNLVVEETKLMKFYEQSSQIRLSNKTTSQSPCLLILSEVVEYKMVIPAIKKRQENQIMDLLLTQFTNLANLHPIQQAILLAIFRVFAQKGVKPSKSGIYKLKSFFQRNLTPPFKNYIVKLFQSNQQLGGDMHTRILNSFYFSNCFWLQKVERFRFSDLNNQMEEYSIEYDLIEQTERQNNKAQLSQIVQVIEHIFLNIRTMTYYYDEDGFQYQSRKNAFQEIYNGELKESYYYPFMMSNNIPYLQTFLKDDHNNQLYKCSGCSEFIFSDACPDLQTIDYPCARCGMLLKKSDNVLKWVNQNINEFRSLVNREQWPGFYLNINSSDYKLDQGKSIHLRIAALLYFSSIKLALYSGQYMSQFSYYHHNDPNLRRSSIINRILKINYSANAKDFINDQINLMVSHIEKEFQELNIKSRADQLLLLTKLVNSLINDQSFTSKHYQEGRIIQNREFVQKIDQIIYEFKRQVEKKQKQIEIYMEKDRIGYFKLLLEYRRSLRTVNPDYSPEQIKRFWFKQFGNNEYLALKFLLQHQELDFLSEVLPILIKFTSMINSRFTRRFSQNDAQKKTLLQIVGNNQRNSIYKYYSLKVIPTWEKVKIFISIFQNKKFNLINEQCNFVEQVRQVLKEFQVGCSRYKIIEFTKFTSLSELVFGKDTFDSQFQKVLKMVCKIQDKLLESFYFNCMSDQSPQAQELKQYVKTILFDSKKNQIKSKTLREISPTFNIVRKINSSIFTQYAVNDFEYASGTTIVDDLVSMQEWITNKVLLGAVRIDLENSNRFQFLEDVHQIGLLENIKIHQVEISDIQRSIFRTVKSFRIAQEVLSHLSTLFSIFKNESKMKESSIQSKLKELKIHQGQFTQSLFPESLKLKHLASSIKLFEEEWMDMLIENCSPLFMQDIDLMIVKQAHSEIKQFKLIGEFITALGRFIIRSLCQTPITVNPEGLLFEALFYVDISGEFWDDCSKLEDNYDSISKNQIKYGQAYKLYKTSKIAINMK